MKGLERQFLECPVDEIAAYIDGELSAERELEMEAHFASCRPCLRDLNAQKQFLCGLSSTLMAENEVELPKDFAKRVVANAESTVAGLRRPVELYNALFICAGLGLFALFALGPEAGTALASVSSGFEQIGAVGGFLLRVAYSVFLGASIIVRSFAGQVSFDFVLTLPLVSLFAAFLFYVTRKFSLTRRV